VQLPRSGRAEDGDPGARENKVHTSQQQHIDMLSQSLKATQGKYEVSALSLAEERRGGRQRHEALVSELSSIVTTCEQAQAETHRWKDESEVREGGSGVELSFFYCVVVLGMHTYLYIMCMY
jgi:hypothetical protein